MNNIDYRLFVGSENQEPLTPVFKGNKVLIYPGDLNDQIRGKLNLRRRVQDRFGSTKTPTKTGLRRYVFRYNKGTFEYIATRMGQRNGGYNSTPNQTFLRFDVTNGFSVPTLSAYPISIDLRYKGKVNLDSTSDKETYSESANSIINYNTSLTRWEWKTRPANIPPAPPSGPFYITAYSSSTTIPLREASSLNGVVWTFLGNPNKPVGGSDPTQIGIVQILNKQWFNNNTVSNLNQWPIKNKDAQGGLMPLYPYKWMNHQWLQSHGGPGGPYGTYAYTTLDGRPDCLSDEVLFKCFKGVELKEYETVFVEIIWRYMQNMCLNGQFYEDYAPYYRGYNLHNVEWFSPKPFWTRRQKGRIYRIGKLAKSNPVGEFDTVTFAQRTRIVTTRWFRGGNKALE